MHPEAHERHPGHLPHLLQTEQGLACADPLQEADPVALEGRERLGEDRAEGVDVEQQSVGGVGRADRLIEPGRGRDAADHDRAPVAVGEVALGHRHLVGGADEHDPRRPLPAHGQKAAESPVAGEHHAGHEEEHGEVEPWHQVAVEDDERQCLHADADRRGEQRAGQPWPPSEPGLALVEPEEVVDDQVDAGGDREPDEVVRQRVRGPVRAEPDQVDHDHHPVEGDRVEHEEEPEPVRPERLERSVHALDQPLGARHDGRGLRRVARVVDRGAALVVLSLRWGEHPGHRRTSVTAGGAGAGGNQGPVGTLPPDGDHHRGRGGPARRSAAGRDEPRAWRGDPRLDPHPPPLVVPRAGSANWIGALYIGCGPRG